MTDADFRAAVYAMRTAQRNYVPARAEYWHVEAKRLEKIVDAELAGVRVLPMEDAP